MSIECPYGPGNFVKGASKNLLSRERLRFSDLEGIGEIRFLVFRSVLFNGICGFLEECPDSK